MIYEALDPASPRPALIRRLRRNAPCLRAYGRSLGVGLEDIAVDDVFIRVVPPVILAPTFVAFLESANGDGSPRFGAGTRRVYRSHASRLARQVVRARRAVLGASDELWTELLEVLGSTDDPPLYRDRNAWALWVFRCRAREVDPYRPEDPAAAIEDYETYVAAWGLHRLHRHELSRRRSPSSPAPARRRLGGARCVARAPLIPREGPCSTARETAGRRAPQRPP